MSIKYEIHSLPNAQGSGKEQLFARIFELPCMTPDELASRIQASSSLTKGDVQAALSALSEIMEQCLAAGNRFYLPSIGYFSLSVELDKPEERPVEKVRGNHLRVRSINFRPDASLLRKVRGKAQFEKAPFSSKSRKYSEEDLLAKLKAYLAVHFCINRRGMEAEFGLRQSAALKWLKHFTETGVLRKAGARNSPVYFLNNL